MNKNQPWDILRFTGSEATWNDKTHKGTTDVENAGIIGGLPAVYFTTAAAHYISVGSAVVLGGVSTYYKGTYKALSGSATDKIYVPARFVDEELTTTATFKLTLAPGHAFEFGGFRLTLDTAATTASELLTITVDAQAGDVYDHILYSQDMNTIKDLDWNIQLDPESFDKGDELDFAWANGDDGVYALEIFSRRR